MATDRARRDATLTRAMGSFFMLGSLCFVAGPLDAYGNAVGARADALTFFVGSILFTLGGASQCLLAAPERPDRPTGLASWRTAWIQSAGTLLFNLMTFAAITVAVTSHRYNTVVWGPNAIGSVCFLVSGTIFYLSSPRRGVLPRMDHEGWWEASVNLLGCVLFGISAVTSYAYGHIGALVSVGVSNWTTTLGAACFLACALTACGLGVTLKAPRLRQLRNIAREVAEAVEHEVREVAEAVEHEVREVAEAVEHEVREVEHEIREVRAYVEAVAETVIGEIRVVE
jgi:tellurite resistance protein